MNKKEEEAQVNKTEMPKFRVTQSHENYDTWQGNPIDIRVGYSLDTEIERDKLF